MGPVVAMTWFKVTDNFYDHPKVMKAGNSAIGLWIRCCTYSANKEEDGRIPMEIAHTYGTRRDIDRLSATGMWMVLDDEYYVPNFLKYNPSHEQLEAKRADEAKRQQRSRQSRRDRQRDYGVTYGDVTS